MSRQSTESWARLDVASAVPLADVIRRNTNIGLELSDDVFRVN